jgi:hypothetical protein
VASDLAALRRAVRNERGHAVEIPGVSGQASLVGFRARQASLRTKFVSDGTQEQVDDLQSVRRPRIEAADRAHCQPAEVLIDPQLQVALEVDVDWGGVVIGASAPPVAEFLRCGFVSLRVVLLARGPLRVGFAGWTWQPTVSMSLPPRGMAKRARHMDIRPGRRSHRQRAVESPSMRPWTTARITSGRPEISRCCMNLRAVTGWSLGVDPPGRAPSVSSFMCA